MRIQTILALIPLVQSQCIQKLFYLILLTFGCVTENQLNKFWDWAFKVSQLTIEESYAVVIFNKHCFFLGTPSKDYWKFLMI